MKLRIYTKKSEQEKRRYLRNNMTRAEVLLWSELKNKKLGVRFLRQYSIGKFVVDFYAPEIKHAIEVDGAAHNTDEERDYDNRRQGDIENTGITFLRFTNEEIYEDLHNVIEAISKMIDQLRKTPSP